MSIGSFVTTVVVDAKKAVGAIISAFEKAGSVIDKTAPTIEAITGMIDPAAVIYEKAIVALFDEVVAAIKLATTEDAGTNGVTLTLTTDVVSQVQKVIADGEGWLASVGVKL